MRAENKKNRKVRFIWNLLSWFIVFACIHLCELRFCFYKWHWHWFVYTQILWRVIRKWLNLKNRADGFPSDYARKIVCRVWIWKWLYFVSVFEVKFVNLVYAVFGFLICQEKEMKFRNSISKSRVWISDIWGSVLVFSTYICMLIDHVSSLRSYINWVFIFNQFVRCRYGMH